MAGPDEADCGRFERPAGLSGEIVTKVPALDGAFGAPGATVRERRRAVEDRLAPLHLLRNRIAYCEPIFGTITYTRRRVAPVRKPLGDLHADALDLISWASPAAATWIASDADQVAGLLALRP